MHMTIVCIALMVMLLMFSDTAMEAARTAARCFAWGVMPALLPMMVLGKMLPNPTKGEHSAKSVWLGTALFSLAAGSPAAAQRVQGICGGLSARGRECLLCLTGVMSPAFFTGTLAGWLGSAREGWLLLGLHWLGAAATAGLWALLGRRGPEKPEARELPPREDAGLAQAIAGSARSLLCVAGAMMTFSAAAAVISRALSAAFPVWSGRHAGFQAFVWAVMEIGGGSSALIGALEEPHAWLSALCGFGGLSIWLQNLLFLDKTIRPARLLGMRAVHGAVCYALVRLLNPF